MAIKTQDRRDTLLDAMTDFVLVNGLASASFAQLANAASTSDRMLVYYFKTKSGAITDILGRVSKRLVKKLDTRVNPNRQPLAILRVDLMTVLLADDLWPYMRLWLDIAARAAHGDQFYRIIGGQIARGFLEWGKVQLESENTEADAAALLIWIEGSVLLKSVGLEDVCAVTL